MKPIADPYVVRIIAEASAGDYCCQHLDDDGRCCMTGRATEIATALDAAGYRIESVERINAILADRDHWKSNIERYRSLATEVAAALGVEGLSGEAQLTAALETIARLRVSTDA